MSSSETDWYTWDDHPKWPMLLLRPVFFMVPDTGKVFSCHTPKTPEPVAVFCRDRAVIRPPYRCDGVTIPGFRRLGRRLTTPQRARAVVIHDLGCQFQVVPFFADVLPRAYWDGRFRDDLGAAPFARTFGLAVTLWGRVSFPADHPGLSVVEYPPDFEYRLA